MFFNHRSDLLTSHPHVRARLPPRLPLFGVTITFIMLNGMKWSELRDENAGGEASVAAKARIFLMAAMSIGIACIAGSAFIMADKFIKSKDGCQWAGVSDFVGTMVILFAAFLMRWGTLPPESGY